MRWPSLSSGCAPRMFCWNLLSSLLMYHSGSPPIAGARSARLPCPIGPWRGWQVLKSARPRASPGGGWIAQPQIATPSMAAVRAIGAKRNRAVSAARGLRTAGLYTNRTPWTSDGASSAGPGPQDRIEEHEGEQEEQVDDGIPEQSHRSRRARRAIEQDSVEDEPGPQQRSGDPVERPQP